MNYSNLLSFGLLAFCTLLFPLTGNAQFVSVDSGSYTTTFPGTDAAGRNTYPSGSPLTIGDAAGKPVPTNDWWSAKIKNNHVANLFSYPFTFETLNQGLVATYIPWGVIDDQDPVIIGVSGLNASVAHVSDFSDWTVTMQWTNGTHRFEATAGIGMPFTYFEKNASDVAQVTVNLGTVTINNEILIITDLRNGADFAIYAPSGSVWNQNGSTYTSTLNGQNYWSMAFLPLSGGTPTALASQYKKYAYVFPTNTRADWNYTPQDGIVTTDLILDTEVKEGTDSSMLIGLLPHQWSHLSGGSPSFASYTYPTVRGELKTMEANRFTVEHTFHGILPTLPNLTQYSPTFDPSQLVSKIDAIKNDPLATWTDSYNEGQVMNRLIQTARIAEQLGHTEAVQTIISTIKTRLEDWLTAEAGEVAFLFYYQPTWTAMIGYPAGHGQDGNINDHHFHWGYFIHAAAFMEQYEPGWADKWGSMINLLVRDAASPNRQDPDFPFLRNFSPYAGHCWANGFASFPQGNDQESTSESMQFNSSLIHWGSITGNDEIRDLGIYLYTTEQSAIEEYWFDMDERNFGPNQTYSLVSRVWGNSYDNGTFWTSDIAASYGIELYPIHGGSLYLGQDTVYADKIWNEMAQYTGILNNEENPNLWHDVVWKYLAMTDPDLAIMLYDDYPERNLKFGVSDAHTYHWLHSMRALGRVDVSLTADHPLAAAFRSGSDITYVAHNYGTTPLTVTFSDGFTLNVPAGSMVTSKDIPIKGVISTDFSEAYAGGSIELDLAITGGTPTKVEFMNGSTMLGSLTQPPFELTATDLTVGKQSFYARIYEGDRFNISNFIEVRVGEQLAYQGDPSPIPGTIDVGHYDFFEGGNGQGITYNDLSPGNNGDFREEENVDATELNGEGATVGWISAGEWLEYTVEVQQAGYYDFSIRYASGNNQGGGPIHLESDGKIITPNINLSYTGDWDNWQTRTVSDVPLKSGKQVLRVFFHEGEFNMGRMTFSFDRALDYSQPVADAGENVLVTLPGSSTTLDASGSSDPSNGNLTYQWTQVYGPTRLTFSNDQAAQPNLSGLIEGVYLLKVVVDNGTYQDEDEVYVISSTSTDVPPKVSIITPRDRTDFIEGDPVDLSAYASDLIGQVQQVDFYVDSIKVGTATQAPFNFTWNSEIGNHIVWAQATDDSGLTGNSQEVSIVVEDAPSCVGTAFNTDFSWEFSDADNNPTLTFIPSQAGVGSPTCILYYGTSTNTSAMGGYGVTPNQPFQITAAAGTRIYFYYTYSFPGQGEKNTAGNLESYVIGSCRNATTQLDEDASFSLKYYPNPVDQTLFLELPEGKKEIEIYSLTGQMMMQKETHAVKATLDMRHLVQGVYVGVVKYQGKREVFKVTK
ncbi:MAG: glycosyl hydrolase [Bacteroidota bacterium]